MVEKFFKIKESGSTVRIELLGGLTTFLTMSYIIFLNPAILSGELAGQETGLSFEAAMLATCLAAAVATILMGLLANYPIAQAPGMGENFFFVTVVIALMEHQIANAWQVALGVVFIAGVIFLILSLFRFRKVIIESVSPSMRNGIAVGIGLFIAFIGLKNTGLIQTSVEGLSLNRDIKDPKLIIFFIGLFVMAALQVRKVRGAILLGMVITTIIALVWGQTEWEGALGLPKETAFFAMDLKGAFSIFCLQFIIIFLFMDMFDTVGTLIGVGEQGGFIKDNKLPRANQALVSDAVGTVFGAAAGTSTVTSFIESTVGIAYGARTGLANCATGILFLLALFFVPLAGMIGNYAPITAPALVLVGAMMARNVLKIDWSDYSEAIPAFLAMVGIPLSCNIADGFALGFISYTIIKLLAGKGREVSFFMYLVSILFILRYVYLG